MCEPHEHDTQTMFPLSRDIQKLCEKLSRFINNVISIYFKEFNGVPVHQPITKHLWERISVLCIFCTSPYITETCILYTTSSVIFGIFF